LHGGGAAKALWNGMMYPNASLESLLHGMVTATAHLVALFSQDSHFVVVFSESARHALQIEAQLLDLRV
jgi:hypothetical protein